MTPPSIQDIKDKKKSHSIVLSSSYWCLSGNDDSMTAIPPSLPFKKNVLSFLLFLFYLPIIPSFLLFLIDFVFTVKQRNFPTASYFSCSSLENGHMQKFKRRHKANNYNTQKKSL